MVRPHYADTITHGSATYHKTQTITRWETSSILLENIWRIPSTIEGIILHAYDADVVIFMIPTGDETTIFPPNFGNSLNREVIGVVSKVDTGKKMLRRLGAILNSGTTNIFEISVHDEESLKQLCNYIYG